MSLSSKPHRTVPANTRRTAKAAFKIGEDGDTLLKCLASSEVATEGQALDSVQTLASLSQYHYSYVEGEAVSCLRWKSSRELNVQTPHIASPYDTEARYCRRQGISWAGYRTHLSETCDDKSVHLITQVMTTDALRHESQCIESIHDALIAKQLPPKEHYVDAACVDSVHGQIEDRI